MGACNLIIAIGVFFFVFFIFGMLPYGTNSKYDLIFLYIVAFVCAISVYFSRPYTCTNDGGGAYENDGRSAAPTSQ